MKKSKLIKRRMGASCGEYCLNEMKEMKMFGLDFTEEEKEGYTIVYEMDEILSMFDNKSQLSKRIKNLNENRKKNFPLLSKIAEENKISLTKIKGKISELIYKGRMIENPPIIGTGNSCNNPCYLYNRQIMEKCPNCNGKVEEDLENGYTIEKVWDDRRETWKV